MRPMPRPPDPAPTGRTTAIGDTLRVVVPYVVVSLLWIYLSDAVVGRLAPDAEHSVLWSTVKGFAFVVATGAMLYVLLRRILDRQQATADALRESLARYEAVAVEREAMEAALRDSEQRFRSVVESAPDAIFAELDGRFTYLNPAALRLFGVDSADALLGTPVLERFDAASRGQVADRLSVIRERREAVPRAELRVVRADGQGVEIETVAVPFDQGGRPGGMAFARDITARRALETRVLRSQRLESLGQLAGGIAHDLNNVLQPVFMGIEQLRASSRDPAAIETLDLMRASAERGSTVVRQVLTFARGTPGERKVIDPAPIVREVETLGRETFPRNITIQSHVEPGLAAVEADGGQVHQALLNLCVNARDAMPDGGTLVLDARTVDLDEQEAAALGGTSSGRFVRLSVWDSGLGIDPAVVGQIFDPFFTTKPPGQGTGLGLSIVHGVVQSHGGMVEVDSRPGEGARFSIYLPAAAGVPVAVQPVGVETIAGGGECILLADDEAIIRSLSVRLLTQSGYTVLTAADGRILLDTWAAHRDEVACVVTDLMMPVMDGHTAIRELRRQAPTLPIVAVSGFSSAPAGLADLHVLHLAKPYSRDQLLTALRKALGKA